MQRWLHAFQGTPHAWAMLLQMATEADRGIALFGANALLSKVRSEWRALGVADAGTKAAVWGAMSQTLSRLVSGATVVDAAAMKRFAQAVASAAALDGSGSMASYVSAALGVVSADLQLASVRSALELLSALGDEAIRRGHVNRAAAIQAVRAALPQLMRLLELAVTGSLVPDAASMGAQPLTAAALAAVRLTPLAHQALACAASFVEAGLSLPLLQRDQPGLLAGLIVALASAPSDSSAQADAVELFEQLVTAAGNDVETTQYARLAATEGAAAMMGKRGLEEPGSVLDSATFTAAVNGLHSVMIGLSAMQHTLRAAASAGDVATMKAIATIGVAVVRSAPHVVAAGGPGPDATVQLLLECTEAPGLDVVIVAADPGAWEGLAGVPEDQRAPAFGAPLFARLLQSVVRGATYPSDFPASGLWDEYSPDANDIEEQEWLRGREQVLREVIQTAYSQLGAAFGTYLRGLLQHALDGDGGWHTAEVLLFALRAVSVDVKIVIAQASSSRKVIDAGTPENAAAMSDLLEAVFTSIGACAPALSSHPTVVESAARVVGAYVTWLVARPAYLTGITQYLLRALMIKPAAPHASSALLALMSKGAAHFASAPSATALVQGFQAGTAAGTLSGDDRISVAQAIVQVANKLSYGDCVSVIEALLAPSFQRIQGILGDPSQAAAAVASSPDSRPAGRKRPPLFNAIVAAVTSGDAGREAAAGGVDGVNDDGSFTPGSAGGGRARAMDDVASSSARVLAAELSVVAAIAKFAQLPPSAAAGSAATASDSVGLVLASMPGTSHVAAQHSHEQQQQQQNHGGLLKHPALIVLEHVWRALESVASTFVRYEAVVAASMDVVQCAMRAARDSCAPWLPNAVVLAVTMFTTAAAVGIEHPACVECIADLVDDRGAPLYATKEPMPAAEVAVFAQAFNSVAATLAAQQAAVGNSAGDENDSGGGGGGAVAEPPGSGPLYEAFFDLAASLTTFCAEALAAAPAALGQALTLAAGVLQLPDRSATLATVTWMGRFYQLVGDVHTAEGGPGAAAHASALKMPASRLLGLKAGIEAPAAAALPLLLQQLLYCLVHVAPPDLNDDIADAVFAAVRAFPSSAQASLTAAATSPALPVSSTVAAAAPVELRAGAATQLLQLALLQDVSALTPALTHTLSDRQTLFGRYLGEFGNLCRGQVGPAALARAFAGEPDQEGEEG